MHDGNAGRNWRSLSRFVRGLGLVDLFLFFLWLLYWVILFYAWLRLDYLGMIADGYGLGEILQGEASDGV